MSPSFAPLRLYCGLLLLIAGTTHVGAFLDKRYNLDQKPQILDALEFAKPGCPTGLTIDVGANGGKESREARRKGYEVLAIECLRKEYFNPATGPDRLTNDSKITLINGCASDKVGVGRMYEAGASSSLHPEAVAQDHEKEVFKKNKNTINDVVTFPLDPIIEGWHTPQPVCVVKIDTQGHEMAVLKGLKGTIRKHRPVVIFELDPRFGPQTNLSAPWLTERFNYDCAVPVPGRYAGSDCKVCNVLCMPDRAMWDLPRPKHSAAMRERFG